METPIRIGLGDIPFHLHGDTLAILVVLAAAYSYGLRRLAPRYAPTGEAPWTGRQVAWFVGGLVLFGAARSWPIHDIGDSSLFTFHMIEHMALTLGVPPMLLLGTPGWLLRILVEPILPALRILTKPLVALLLFNGTLAIVHAPAVVELMLTSEVAHLGLHALMMVTATLMWWPVIGPIPDIPRLSPFMAMGYVFLQSLVPTIPASFLTFASGPVYPVYADLPRLWGVSVLDDQLIAGLLMKVGGGLLLWAVIATIWFRWAAAEERTARPARLASPR